jgi:hypothetical protein
MPFGLTWRVIGGARLRSVIGSGGGEYWGAGSCSLGRTDNVRIIDGNGKGWGGSSDGAFCEVHHFVWTFMSFGVGWSRYSVILDLRKETNEHQVCIVREEVSSPSDVQLGDDAVQDARRNCRVRSSVVIVPQACGQAPDREEARWPIVGRADNGRRGSSRSSIKIEK